MANILITGATGNIGKEVIDYLMYLNTNHQIVAGVRNIEKSRKKFNTINLIKFVKLDFKNPDTFDRALHQIDLVFLLRPPHISDIKSDIEPFLKKLKENEIHRILFLSVQGADKSNVIPHNKIEKLILKYNLSYFFLRPSYFMQNLTTTLYDDLKNKNQIILPAGNAKFNWVDIKNIAETIAIILNDFDEYKNQIHDLTGLENKSFNKIIDDINQTLNTTISYKNVTPFRFYLIKKQEGIPKGMILVMIMLHFLPRFQKVPKISDFYKKLTGKNPNTITDFIEREKDLFLKE